MGHKRRTDSLKTRPTDVDVEEFIDGLEHEPRQRDSRTMLAMMKEITGQQAVMWGSGIVGFGSYRYEYNSGREGEWPRTGFSPRKHALTVYCMLGFEDHEQLLKRLGRHTKSVSCLYLPSLEDVDLEVLRQLVADSYEAVQRKYPPK